MCHNFKDAPNPICDCGPETETTDYVFLCGLFSAEIRQQLLNSLFKIDVSLKNLNDEMLSDSLLFGSDKEILVLTINFLKATKPFKIPLFFERWYHFVIIFLISHLFCKHDVVTLVAPYQIPQISGQSNRRTSP